MNIVYIYRSLTAFGGVERVFIDKANYLAEQMGHTVYIFTFEQGRHPIVFNISPKVRHIDLGVCFYKIYQYGILKRFLLEQKLEKQFYNRLKEQIQAVQADIVVCATCEFTVMKTVTRLRHKVATVIESHNAKRFIEKSNDIKGNPVLKTAFKYRDRLLSDYVKKADAFVVLTRQDALDWQTVTSAHVVPNLLTYYPEKIDILPKKRKHVISAGRLTRQKGYDLLLQAWQKVYHKHPDWILDIYGKGEDYNMLTEYIRELQLQQVVNIHPPTTDIYDKYMESDFYVMSSRWEGFGLVLAEAMSCGIPCVAFDCPHGPSDIISQGQDGILVENGNIDLLAEKIIYLIEQEDIRLEMGRKARENVKRFLPQAVMPQWENLFKSLQINQIKIKE